MKHQSLLIHTGLMLIAMGLIQCTEQAVPEEAFPVTYDAPIMYESGLCCCDELGTEADDIADRVYIADVIWGYETEHPIRFGVFPEQTITVEHRVEDAWVRIRSERIPDEREFTRKAKPPHPGAIVLEIQTKRRWPIPDLEPEPGQGGIEE